MSARHQVAVLGGGFIGQAHIIALRQVPSVDIALLVDHRGDNAQRKAAFWGIPQASADWQDALSDHRIDAVHICLPNHLHAEVLEACLRAGKAVFAEKPLTMTLEEAERLSHALAALPNLPLVDVNFNYRHYPMVGEMRRLIAEGAIGRPFLAIGRYLQDWMLTAPDDPGWRAEPGRGGPSRALWDIGSHVLDLSEFALGEPIVRVEARAGRKASSDGPPRAREDAAGIDDDYTLLWFETAGQASGHALASQVNGGHKNDLALEIAGTDGSLSWLQEHPDTLWLGRPGKASETVSREVAPDFRQGSRAPYPSGHVMGWPDALRLAVEAFYAALDGDRAEGARASLQTGLHMMAVIDACRASALSGSSESVRSV